MGFQMICLHKVKIQVLKHNLKVFEKIFKETGHEAHYKMMMRIK